MSNEKTGAGQARGEGEPPGQNEEPYRVLVDLAPEPIIVQVDRKLAYVNPAAVEAFGAKSAADLLGRSVTQFIHPDQAPIVAHRIDRVLAGESVSFMEQRFIRLDGSVGDAEVASIPLTFEGKQAVLTVARDISARRAAERERMFALRAREEAEAARRASEERVRAQFRAIPVPTYAWQRIEREGGDEFRLVDYNDAATRLSGGAVASLLGKTLGELRGSDAEIGGDVARTLREGTSGPREIDYTVEATGERKRLSVSYIAVPPDLVLVYTEDITQRIALEERLREAERLEAMGRLAGGVAHDFNNLLMVMRSYAASVAQSLGDANPLVGDVEEISRAADRAAGLTRQLLAFGRRQVMQPRSINLNATVRGMEGLLRRLIGEDIRIDLRTAPQIGRVHADPGQLEQVIVNLAVNARDAMPTGGTLTLETADAEIGQELGGSVAPGSYVRLSVRDTGHGMDPATCARAFEPFFTTKAPGRGTGLGLATVYGIVKQSSGSLRVETAPGRGTNFEVYLPREGGPPASAPIAPEPEPQRGGTGTVLVTEDEDAVRTIIKRILERAGYRVLDACNGRHALRVAAAFPGPIDVLVTDMVMPEMGGRELYDKLQSERAGLRVVYMSGYTDDEILRRGDAISGSSFLQKPFTDHALLEIVRGHVSSAR